MDDMRKAFDEWVRRENPAGCVADMWLGWQAATLAERERSKRIIDAYSAQMDCDAETEQDMYDAIDKD